MEMDMPHTRNHLLVSVGKLARKFIFRVLSSNGPIPDHFAFILDGNRRYAKKCNLEEGGGHLAGFISLIGLCRYLYELGVKYITVYAFSIDNFKRKPQFVEFLMDLFLYKTDVLLKQAGILSAYGIKILFIGTLKHLKPSIQEAARRLAEATCKNNKAYLLVCLSYTSTDEIVRAVEASCKEKVQEMNAKNGTKSYTNCEVDGVLEKLNGHATSGSLDMNGTDGVLENLNEHATNGSLEMNGSVLEKFNGHATNGSLEMNGSKNFQESKEDVNIPVINLTDIEKHMYMGVAPDPCLLVRTSGETRLSNYLLWQTSHCILYSPETLWPEIGMWDILWSILLWQRHYPYLEKKRKQT